MKQIITRISDETHLAFKTKVVQKNTTMQEVLTTAIDTFTNEEPHAINISKHIPNGKKRNSLPIATSGRNK